MASDEKWYFTKEQLENTPTRRCGCPAEKELSYRQRAAKFIQDMGQRLSVTQLCINTAIVYMHRFYVFHSFTHFPWYSLAAAALFLAAKVEEQPRKLEHVIRMANNCRLQIDKSLDPQSEQYMDLSQDLVFNENVLLQTLGFDVAIDHPHTHVVKCCHLVRASKDLAQTSYFMASNTLHLTTMCLQYKPTVVACFCIHLACKWSNWAIPLSNEQREWFYYVDKTVTADLLEQVTAEFFSVYERYPTRLKNRISQGQLSGLSSAGLDADSKKSQSHPDNKDGPYSHHSEPKAGPSSQDDVHKRPVRPHDQNSDQYKLYKAKKERERISTHLKPPVGANPPSNKHPPVHSNHHRPSIDPTKNKPQTRPAVLPNAIVTNPSIPPSSSSRPESNVRERVPPRDASGASNRDWEMATPWSDSTRDTRDTNQVNRELNKDTRIKDFVLPRVDNKTAVDGIVRSVHSDKQLDASRPRPSDAAKVPSKHDPNRVRREESKQFAKLPESDKRHSANSVQDKSSAFLPTKPNNATSQRLKSPYNDATKSVPTSQANKTETRNGNLSLPSLDESLTRSSRPEEHRLIILPINKKPSLFSPEQTTPPKKPRSSKTPPSAGQRLTDTPQLPTTSGIVPALSPFNTTPAPKSTQNSNRRNRTSSSGSEPELRPVIKKLDQITGYENVIKDSSIGIKLPKVPDIIQPITDAKVDFPRASLAKELKPPDLIAPFNSNLNEKSVPSQPIVNGIETNPAVISILLKEIPTASPLIPVNAAEKVEHHHKSEKKKKKEKHKHKDKSKNKEDKEKKKKHKDKDREKHKSKSAKLDEPLTTAPIKITIPKDKITTPDNPNPGLKIKIPRDKLKTDNISSDVSGNSNLLKIKISKDQISGFSGESRKRDREKSSPSPLGPPTKTSKTNYSRSHEMRQNGRNSYTPKVAQGDGDSSLHRLAESKYLSKAPPPQ